MGASSLSLRPREEFPASSALGEVGEPAQRGVSGRGLPPSMPPWLVVRHPP